MKIGMFLDHYPLEDGTTIAVRGLAHALAQQKSEVVIYSHGSSTQHTDESRGVTSIQFPRSPLWRIKLPARDLLDCLSRNDHGLDLLILNGIFTPALRCLQQIASIPTIISPHDPYHPAMFRKGRIRKALYWNVAEKTMLQQATAVQLLSANHERLLRIRGIKTPAIVVPNGVTQSQLRQHVTFFPFSTKGLRLGHLGRIALWHKGLDILIEGIALAASSVPELSLQLTGRGGSDTDRLQEIVQKLNLSEIVTISGPTDMNALDTIAQWDALIVAARYDGFPQTVLESMLARRPAIVSAEAGVSEHIVHSGGGLVVEPTAKGIATGICNFYNNRNRWEEMGDKGRNYVEANLSWDEIACQALAHYRILASKSLSS